MKFAVIGGKGFIGREFVAYAGDNGHDTVVIGSDCDVFADDGAKKARGVLKSCDAMIFLAAKRTTPSFSMSEYFYNISLAEKYMQLAREALIEDVILMSSFSVYSSTSVNWAEDEFHTPLSLYGASKQAVDAIAMLYNEKYGMKIKSLRLAQVIGMGERKGYLLNTLIDNAIAGNKQIIYGKGIGRRQYIYVRDVCDSILHSAVNEKDTAGIFNIGMNYNVTIKELAEIINDVFNNASGIELLDDKPEDTREYLMDVSKSKRELHWKPAYDLRETFSDIKNRRGKDDYEIQ